MKKIQKTIFTITVLCSSITCVFPNPGYAFSNDFIRSDYEHVVYNLIECANRGDIEGVDLQLKNIASILYESDDTLNDSCEFLQVLVDKLNFIYGSTLTVSELLQQSRNVIQQFPISEQLMERCKVGFDLIELQNSIIQDPSQGNAQLIKHKENKSGFWTWLSIATITAGAVALCIVLPEVAPAVIGGAVEVGKAAVGK